VGSYTRAFGWFKQIIRPGTSPDNGQELQLQHQPLNAQDTLVAVESTEGKEQANLSVQPDKPGEKKIWGGYWLEWLIIFLAVTLFCAGILDLRAPTRLPGNESEVFQMLDWTMVNSIQQYHAFPLWNIYIQSGLPYIADPMLHVYNPVVTVPVLLLGVRAGFKLGVYFSFLIAAFGMWRLAYALGLGRAARLWTALMFAFAGQPVARFLQGQYLFIFGFAYIPWIISSLILVTQHLRRRDIAVAAGFLALLFFSGNAYYPLYTLLIIGLFMLVMLLRIRKQPPFITLDTRRTFAFLGIGALAVGMIAIQLLPTAEFWPRLSKDLNLAGSQTVKQIFLDYTSKDSMRPDAYSVLPAREEFYAYIGLTPFLGLALLPLAIWKRDRRTLLFFALIVLLTVGWISLEWMPGKEAFLQIRFFQQFRHLLRILVFGSFALICLAGIGMDSLWRLLSDSGAAGGNRHPNGMRMLTTISLVLLSAFMLFGVGDLFATNQFAIHSQDTYSQAYHVMNWVRQNDLGDYYVRHNPTNAWQEAVISNNLHYLDAWYHFADIRSLDGKINERFVQAQPNYLTQSSTEQTPAGAELIAVVDDYQIFSLPESLPLAFMVDNAKLQSRDVGRLVRSEVTPLTPFFSSPNHMDAIGEGLSNQTLVVMMTLYPGWQVLVDGKAETPKNVSGYLAVDVQPGVHKYTFRYSPRLFFIGLVMSGIATAIAFGLFISDLKFDPQAIKVRWLTFWDGLKQARQRLAGRTGKPRLIIEEAVYREGILKPIEPLELEEDSHVRVTIEPQAGLSQGKAAWQRWRWATSDLAGTIWRAIPLGMALFSVAISLYLLTRLIGLANFPIYFFTDEAVQTVMAEDFVQDGLRNYDDELLPTYFNRNSTYNLSSVSVYLQVVPYLLFGKSVFVTRAVSVLISTLGALAVGLILRDIFKLRYWWCGVLLLSIAPAWFLHSRTAFETVEMASFYAGFLYFYLRYRCISPKALYSALVMGALVFYTYSPGQLIMVVTGVFLLISDLRYHWQNRKVALRGLLLLAVLVVPYLRYSLAHPEALMQHLATRAPYWTQNISLFEKLRHYFSDYLYGLNPLYWFIPNQHDLERHLMKDYGHLFLSTLPFFGLGLVIVLLKLRSSAHRSILFAMLAAPTGSALVGIGITRILVFVIPAVVMIALGLERVLDWLESGLKQIIKRRGATAPERRLPVGISLALLVVFGTANLAMLRDSLVNGPTWYQDYTLAGMQYGASQLFEAVNNYVSLHPDAELMVSPSWTNGADAIAEFFLPADAPVRMGSVEGHLFQQMPLNDQMVFVMIPAEMDKVVASGKFKNVRVDEVLPYPDEAAGFYFVRLQYVDNIGEILTAEQEVRSALQEATLMILDEPVLVGYSVLDMGSIELIFDGDLNSVARTLEANPLIVELTFPDVVQLSGYKMMLGSADVRVTTVLYPDGGGQPVQSVATFDGSVSNPELEVNFDRTVSARKVRFEIFQPYSGVPANVHVWEIEFK